MKEYQLDTIRNLDDADIAPALRVLRVGQVKAAIDTLRNERNAISANFRYAPPEDKAAWGRRAKRAGQLAAMFEWALLDR